MSAHEILWYDAKELCHVWEIASEAEAKAAQEKVYTDADASFSVSYFQDFVICSVWSECSKELYSKEGVCSAAFPEGRCVYEPLALSEKLCLRQFFAISQEELILSAPMNDFPRKIQQANLTNMTLDNEADIAIENRCCTPFYSANVSDSFLTLV